MPRKHRVVEYVVRHLAMPRAMCESREQLSYDFHGFGTALDVDGPSAAGVECAAEQVPPFTPFLARSSAKPIAIQQIPITKEKRTDVAART
jgi:hypothetical protein